MISRQLKLCLINPTISHRTMIYGLAKHLPKKNFEVTILQPTSSYKVFEGSYRSEGRIKVVYFPSFFLPKIVYTIPFIPVELKVLLKLRDYDIIHVGDYFYPTSIPPLISNRRKTTPMILVANALPGYSWQFGSVLVDLVAKGYTCSIGKQILNRYDRIVVLYNKLSEDLRRLGVPSQKISVIPNGVDVERFQEVDEADMNELRKRLSIQYDEKIVLFVGRLSKVKRVDLIIRLAQRLNQKGQPIKTIIVGDGPYRKSYEQLVSSHERFIIFTGEVSPTFIPLFYAIADVVVLTSLYEGLPNVLLEASAAGKPVVATKTNGVPEIVVHGKTGFLVDKYDYDSFYKFTQLILSDQDLRKKLGHKAIAHVKKNFNWLNAVEKYESLYHELLCTR